MLKKVLIVLLILLVAIQFIRPERNQSNAQSPNDITSHYDVPANIQLVLQKACYDCHSNSTKYPWYTNIQPVGLWLQNHVDEGKEHLNFSEFASYNKKKQAHKLEEVGETVEGGEMPLSSYTIIHHEAKLSKEDRDLLLAWAKSLQQQIAAQQ
ncbi:heme-binding domain-containing protein [Polluticoccus soli]|uniref:heme-binding domain-containing protein n=1 Tax=Polluticoccus soli TaxID=3034150 RepID=UPI0023E2793D|nr:heme-binding domain-containing protein [Flavipsychrobacter sp. JY13-12]